MYNQIKNRKEIENKLKYIYKTYEKYKSTREEQTNKQTRLHCYAIRPMAQADDECHGFPVYFILIRNTT